MIYLKNKKLGTLLIALLSLLIVVLVDISGILLTFEQKLSNFFYTEKNPSEKIIIVGIDDKSYSPEPYGLDLYSTWPREYYTKVIKNIDEGGAKVIGLDILFRNKTKTITVGEILGLKLNYQKAENKEEFLDGFFKQYLQGYPNADKSLADEMKKAKSKIILPFIIKEEEIIFPLELFKQSASAVGYINAEIDKSGFLRTIFPKYENYEDFGVLISKAFLNREELILPTHEDKMYVNYFEKSKSYEQISFSDVYKGDYDKEIFKGKIVLIGITSQLLNDDKFLTPVSNKSLMPGVEFRANEIQTIIENKFIFPQSEFYKYLSLIIFALIFGALAVNANIILSAIIFLLSYPLYYFFGLILFKKGIIIELLPLYLLLVFIYIFSFAYRYFISDKTGRDLKNAFSKYVSPALVDKISAAPDKIKLGGEKRVITVFFTDIKDSTSFSEKIEISKWVAQLNEYFTMMESVIKARGGTVDKFEGDAIMGFFGAPLDEPDQILRAYLAALDMKIALAQLHEKWASQGLPLINFRIGINTGEAIVGNFGSINRFDYTAMGDTVNTASRLESSANKTYGTTHIVANFNTQTDEKSLSQYIVIREIDTVILVGKNLPTKLYELVCKKTELSNEIQNIVTTYQTALIEYKNKNFEKARELFSQISTKDNPSKVMLERVEKLLRGEVLAELDVDMNYIMKSK